MLHCVTAGDRTAGMGPSSSAAPCYQSVPVTVSHRKCNRGEGKEKAMYWFSTTYLWCPQGELSDSFPFVAHSTSMEIVANNRTVNRNGNGKLYHLTVRSEPKGLVLKTLVLPQTQSTVEISLGLCCC